MLAAIGTVIGHEISHAFDTNGAQYDKDGAFANWWTEEDYAAFQARAAKLAAWYDGFIPFEVRITPDSRCKRKSSPIWAA